ncbi:MAG TPA: hypothetical protein VH092_29280, partial [Urbifossiella sp.]|nr:hypothetical protein [Urbifossiella sp.]
AGLPVTSSWVESLIKGVNDRVKGTAKFWNEAGAENVLHADAGGGPPRRRPTRQAPRGPTGSAFRRPIKKAA